MATKRILLLANSRKNLGRCLAGKEPASPGFGAWIRPVSNRPTEEISEEDRQYQDGTTAQLLDIVDVPVLQAKPHGHQSENFLIDDTYYWTRVGVGTWADVCQATDTLPGPLWINGHSSYNGENDFVPGAQTVGLTTSLYLIQPQNLQVHVGKEGYAEKKRKLRGRFSFNGVTYKLMITDPQVAQKYLAGPDGAYPVPDARLCISLGEVFHGSAYKLIAALITPV